MKNLNFREKIIEKYNGQFSFEKLNYVNNKTPVTLTCREHGDFTAWPGPLLYQEKRGCPHCNGRLTPSEFIQRARSIHGETYRYDHVEFKGVNAKITVVCKIHGSFTIEARRHLSGQGCRDCFIAKKRLSFDIFKERASAIHGSALSYDKTTWVSGRHKVLCICVKHGEFYARANSILSGVGCKQCSYTSQRKDTAEFLSQIKTFMDPKIDTSKVIYRGSKKKVALFCPEHGEFKRTPNDLLVNKAGCPHCKESKGERRVRIFLESKKLSYVKEYKLEGHLYRWDFYLPDFHTFIEYNGIQHYVPVEAFGGEKAFRECTIRDLSKKKLVHSVKGKLIVISCLDVRSPETILEHKLKSLKII